MSGGAGPAEATAVAVGLLCSACVCGCPACRAARDAYARGAPSGRSRGPAGRPDEAGTPYGVTIDFDTLGENGDESKDTITLRDRDTMEQTRMPISELLPFLLEKIR